MHVRRLALISCFQMAILAIMVAASSIPVSAAPASTPGRGDIEATLQATLDAFHEAGGFPGATLGYVLPDGTSGSVSVGVASKETNTPMSATHRLMAGSTGKTFFAALTLRLVDEGLLDLDEKISTWLGDEEWFDRLPNARDLTLRQLMRHQSGWPRWIEQVSFLQRMKDDPDAYFQPGEQLSYIFDMEPEFAAGEDWAYSDTNYIAVALICEKVTGDSCYNLIFERLLRPNGLWDIIPTTTRDLVGMSNGYVNPRGNLFSLTEEAVIQQGRYVFNPQMEWGGGGFATTPADLARWGHLLYTGDLLSDAMKKEMRNTVEAKLGPGSRYGLALMERPSDMGVVIGHSGYFPGFLTDMSHYTEHGVTLAFQVNTTTMSRALNPRSISGLLDECAAAIVAAD